MKRLRQFWQMTRPFWISRAALPAWGLLVLIVALTLLGVWFSVRFNQWNGDFYNALQGLQSERLYELLRGFVLLVAGLILVVVYADYLRKKLLIRWREWLSQHITARWLSAQSTHYRLQLQVSEPDNPDQRIAEDVQLMVEFSLKLLLSFIRSSVTLASFVSILWLLPGSLELEVAGQHLSIPGFMVWACVLYTLVGIALTHWIGSSLQPLNMGQQKREADYRHALIMRREQAAAIAGQAGEAVERETLGKRFSAVAGNWYRLMRAERNLAFFTTGYQQVTMVAPFFFAMPKFLSGELALGGLMRIQSAFGQVASSLSWFIYAYKDIAVWSASVQRLHAFSCALEQASGLPAQATVERPEQPVLQARLQVELDNGRSLLPWHDWDLAAGSTTLLRGRSGLGKSTLLSCLAGFWPHYQGQVMRHGTLAWLPQGMRLGDGSLAELLAYPQRREVFSQADLTAALIEVGLGHLQGELMTEQEWARRLSGGEQQRVLFARLLLNRPDLALLDETTSALDLSSARHLLQVLRTHLPETAILLVSHQQGLDELADRIVDLNTLDEVREAHANVD